MESDQQGAIEATGCSELNDALLLCYDTHRDWRRCKIEMDAFRKCYEKYMKDSIKQGGTVG